MKLQSLKILMNLIFPKNLNRQMLQTIFNPTLCLSSAVLTNYRKFKYRESQISNVYRQLRK